MTDAQADATQADADSQSQADTSSDSPAEQETISLDEARKLRSEASGLRKRLKDAETKAQAAVDAGRTDEEKRQAALKAADDRATAAEQRLRDANARSAVTDAATKANATSTRAVYALIRSDLEFDDDGEPTNVSALISQAKKEEPSLFRAAAGSGDGGARGESGAAGNGNDLNALLRASMRRG